MTKAYIIHIEILNIQRQHYVLQVWIHLGFLAEAVSEKEKVPSEHLFQINIDIDNDLLNPFYIYQSGTFGGSNILEPGSNILEPQNFIFNILEGNEEKKL